MRISIDSVSSNIGQTFLANLSNAGKEKMLVIDCAFGIQRYDMISVYFIICNFCGIFCVLNVLHFTLL